MARLNVLERHGRYQEYLYLAEGQTERYVVMLVRLGRVQEAVDYGLNYAEHGLDLEGPRAMLAKWLGDLAADAGREELALKSALVAFGELLSLEDYRAVRSLAGDRWPRLREKMLAELRRTGDPRAQVEVFLEEGLLEEAISVADANPRYYDLVERVVEAATHPDWAIRACLSQAERVIDQGKAKSVYLSTGRGEEWRSYLEGLIEKHGRKYSLIPMLERLR